MASTYSILFAGLNFIHGASAVPSWKDYQNLQARRTSCLQHERDCMQIPNWQIAVIVIATWCGFLFVIGMMLAYGQFKNMMTGRLAKRGVPPTLALLFPPLSLIFCIPDRKILPRRSDEDRQVLLLMWNTTPRLTKLRLFFRHGFRNDIPPILDFIPTTSISMQTVSPPPVNRPENGQVRNEPPPPPYAPRFPEPAVRAFRPRAEETPNEAPNEAPNLPPPPKYEAD
ncbi:hypothetical protein AJ80_07292 [Polytolypa hystricis UAMH7299]|uniref:Uncharacterized protein n=1 Tax=Polytolypa hystricis (strain UAMH7299) TaxID=1447883 RepID=A0A2B7XPC8_POLH7|nr:hypothetical protein AJ80_07292 [Polytolypa hystricis UAMH7299]